MHGSGCAIRWPATSLALIVGLLVAPIAVAAYRPGDRVECDTTGSKGVGYRKGVVIAFVAGDTYNGYSADSGYFSRVRLDGWSAEGIFCKTEDLRAENDAAPAPSASTAQSAASTAAAATPNAAVDTFPADRPLLQCPFVQPTARNGDAPDVELLARVFRCQYGEKPAAPGLDGAVTVDVASMQVGRSRKWIYAGGSGGGDLGGGDADTVVWPIKTTFTEKVHYRYSTAVSADAIRIFHFFVNGFGEWQYGSAESVKRPEISTLPR